MILHQLRITPIMAAQSRTIGEAGAPVAYYEPDADGTMEVLAECGRHYARQPQRDLLDGVGAPCPKAVCAMGVGAR